MTYTSPPLPKRHPATSSHAPKRSLGSALLMAARPDTDRRTAQRPLGEPSAHPNERKKNHGDDRAWRNASTGTPTEARGRPAWAHSDLAGLHHRLGLAARRAHRIQGRWR